MFPHPSTDPGPPRPHGRVRIFSAICGAFLRASSPRGGEPAARSHLSTSMSGELRTHQRMAEPGGDASTGSSPATNSPSSATRTTWSTTLCERGDCRPGTGTSSPSATAASARTGSAWPRCCSAATSALISYQSAVWLWGLERKLEIPVNVSVRWRGHGQDAIGLHHCPALRDEDVAETERLPVTAVPRTLLDYASTAKTYPPRTRRSTAPIGSNCSTPRRST